MPISTAAKINTGRLEGTAAAPSWRPSVGEVMMHAVQTWAHGHNATGGGPNHSAMPESLSREWLREDSEARRSEKGEFESDHGGSQSHSAGRRPAGGTSFLDRNHRVQPRTRRRLRRRTLDRGQVPWARSAARAQSPWPR